MVMLALLIYHETNLNFEMIDYTQWSRKVYSSIRNIADLDFQKRAWMGGGNEVSSYVETIASLLDDSFFDEFLDEAARSETKLDDDSWAAMDKLRKLIYSYQELETDSAILEDPKWHEIVNQAKFIVRATEIS